MCASPTILRAAITSLWCCFFSATATAVPVRVEFSGHLFVSSNASFGSGSLIDDGPFAIGDNFSGHLVYESSTPPSSFGSTSSFHRNAVTEFVADFGALGQLFFNPALVTNPAKQYTVATVGDAGTPRFYAGAINDLQAGFTGQAFQGTAGLISFGSSASQPLANWSLAGASINTIAGHPMNVGQLPIPTSISELSNGRGDNFNLQYWSAWVNPANGQYRHGIFSVGGRITQISLGATAVPEPSLFGLLTLSLLVLWYKKLCTCTEEANSVIPKRQHLRFSVDAG